MGCDPCLMRTTARTRVREPRQKSTQADDAERGGTGWRDPGEAESKSDPREQKDKEIGEACSSWLWLLGNGRDVWGPWMSGGNQVSLVTDVNDDKVQHAFSNWERSRKCLQSNHRMRGLIYLCGCLCCLGGRPKKSLCKQVTRKRKTEASMNPCSPVQVQFLDLY